MDEYLIAKFLREQGLDSAVQKAQLIQKITKYDDIEVKFLEWIKTGKYDDELQIERWTASDIHKLAPMLSGIGVYNFMVDLRDRPEGAKRYIDEGFPVL